MPVQRAVFLRVLQNTQVIEGPDGEEMQSEIDLVLQTHKANDEVDETPLTTIVKLTTGAKYESDFPLEVYPPTLQADGSRYKGPINWEAFRDVVEQYYRRSIGSEGTGIRIGAGSSNIVMRNNIIEATVESPAWEVEDRPGGGGW